MTASPESGAPPLRYGIALGSNVGDRLGNLSRAAGILAGLHEGSNPPLQSPIYETESVDCDSSTVSFYNSVVEIESGLSPRDLLRKLQAIEREFGRPSRRPRNAPRTLDLDILYAGDRTVDEDDLHLPHPRLHERRFVLEPLAAIRPDLILPGQSRTIAQLFADLDSPEPPLVIVTRKW